MFFFLLLLRGELQGAPGLVSEGLITYTCRYEEPVRKLARNSLQAFKTSKRVSGVDLCVECAA